MAKAAKVNSLNHGVGVDHGRGGGAGAGAGAGGPQKAWNQRDLTSPPSTIKLSKAERLLGVADMSSLSVHVASPSPTSDAGRQTLRRGKGGLTSALHDLKGALSGASRYATRVRRPTPNPPFSARTTDSDSTHSVTSPTLDTSTTTASTLPSHTDPPASPYFSHRGSESPSSSHGPANARLDYHAALRSDRHKKIYDPPTPITPGHLKRVNMLPPLEQPPLSPVSKPETPRTLSTFAPINRLRSPSANSVGSETTAKGWRFGRGHGKTFGKETYLDYASSPSTDQPMPIPHIPLPPMPTTRADSAAIEQWLARADLGRRLSTLSSAVRSTKSAKSRNPRMSTFSASSSQLSVRTLTTQPDASRSVQSSQMARPPALRNVRSSDELDNFAVARRQPSFRNGPDLLIESVLSLSSSDEESGDEASSKQPGTAHKTKRVVSGDLSTPQLHRAASMSSTGTTATTAPQILEMQRQAIIQKRSAKKGSRRPLQPIVTPPPPPPPPLSTPGSTQGTFGKVEWRSSEDNEGSVSALSSKTDNLAPQIVVTRKGNRKVDSIIVSPTSKVMVVSKKEEKVLTQMREGRRTTTDAQSITDSEGTSPGLAPPRPPPIISVSPPRRQKRTKASDGVEEMIELSENRVITFPAPPTLPMIGNARGRAGSMSLSLSREVLTELGGMPDMYGSGGNECDRPPLPTGTAPLSSPRLPSVSSAVSSPVDETAAQRISASLSMASATSPTSPAAAATSVSTRARVAQQAARLDSVSSAGTGMLLQHEVRRAVAAPLYSAKTRTVSTKAATAKTRVMRHGLPDSWRRSATYFASGLENSAVMPGVTALGMDMDLDMELGDEDDVARYVMASVL